MPAGSPSSTRTPRVHIFPPLPTLAAVSALGITQVVSWGTSFYALGVLGGPIGDDTGWSGAVVFGGFTVSVLVASFISAAAGRWIDRYGARVLMSLGFVLLAATLWLLAQVETVWHYFGAWALVGVAMRLTLYDAAFAAAVQVDAANGKRGIAFLTVFGGFASTVGWPIGHALNDAYGWRTTLELFAMGNLLINIPLVWLACSYRAPQPKVPAPSETSKTETTTTSASDGIYLTGRARVTAMVLFAMVMSANGINFGVAAIHLVTIIEASGLAIGVAVAIASFKGVAQVAARVFDILFGARLPPMQLARIAVGSLVIAFLALLLLTSGPEAALLFVVLFGVANGLATIVRGTVPLALFGPEGYGLILGILATPFLLFNALSPLAFALVADAYGVDVATWMLLGIACVGALMMEVLIWWYANLQRPNPEAELQRREKTN